ncbi:MAG: hypothetical protein HQL31_00770 [Planctomycetes bacterium]|nr:hypothetical protein [Planctomycetota bacterium]
MTSSLLSGWGTSFLAAFDFDQLLSILWVLIILFAPAIIGRFKQKYSPQNVEEDDPNTDPNIIKFTTAEDSEEDFLGIFSPSRVSSTERGGFPAPLVSHFSPSSFQPAKPELLDPDAVMPPIENVAPSETAPSSHFHVCAKNDQAAGKYFGESLPPAHAGHCRNEGLKKLRRAFLWSEILGPPKALLRGRALR